MARTVALYVACAALLASNWLRLQHGGAVAGTATWIVILALAPAVVRGRWFRVAAAVAASLLAAAAAFDVSLGELFSKAPDRFGSGFLQFYEEQLPFDAVHHPRMQGVILLALFASCLFVGLAIASRRPLLAGLLLLAGAGWPATLLPGHDLLRGALILAVVLALVCALGQRSPLALAPAVVAGAAVVAVAAALAGSSAVARPSVLAWQNWDPYTRHEAPVGVRYVWDSSFRGIRFPKKQTVVLRVRAPRRATYWRATSLDAFDGTRWRESTVPTTPVSSAGRDELFADPLLTPAAFDRTQWVKQRVQVVGLRDRHLVGASIPIAFTPGVTVDYASGGVAEAFGFLPAGKHYLVWSYLPRPTPEALSRSTARYPRAALRDLRLAPGVVAPPFGTPGRARAMRQLLAAHRRDRRIAPYRPLYRTALAVVGEPRAAYGAAVGLEAWFRSGGGFHYDTQPERIAGVPPLAAFVTTSRRGYCQHFAGAMALMLRYLGIPARVAAGFTSGRYSRSRHEWIVSDHDAHTWVEAWFDEYGWLPFDPTPRRGTLAGSYTSASPTFDASGALLALAAKAAGSRLRGASVLQRLSRTGGDALSGRAPNLRGQRKVSAKRAAHNGGLPKALLLVLVALAAVAVVPAVKLARRRARYLTSDPRRVAAACVRELADILADQRVSLRRGMSVGELAGVAEAELGVDAGRFAAAASAARYGPAAVARGAAERARDELRSLRSDLRGQLARGERVRGLLSLRSLGLS
jgi:transglutaminase-like putative cysteine protease